MTTLPVSTKVIERINYGRLKFRGNPATLEILDDDGIIPHHFIFPKAILRNDTTEEGAQTPAVMISICDEVLVVL
jgi:hypothetical protein